MSRRRWRFRPVWLVPVLAFLALSAWAFASPVGASPDDDYHLASIWCANEARTDLCAPDPDHREGYRLILPGIYSAPCYVKVPEQSAGCQTERWVEHPEPSVAGRHGNWNGAYPPIYYAAMNVFASTDIQASALVMRVVNVAIFVGYTTALALLLPRRLRVPLLAGWTIVTVPLAAYLIASNNPGSWAVTGVGGSWLALLGWFQSTGRRAWALGGLAALGVVMAAGARTEAAVFAGVGLVVASILAFERKRAHTWKLALPAALAVVAFLLFVFSGYARVATGGLSAGVPNAGERDPLSVLAFNVISVPRLWTGVFGSWGLGWRMETWPGYALVEFAGLATFIGLASLGLLHMHRRKAVAVTAVVAILFALPVYILTIGRSVVGENVQPRYLLPLVVVLAGLLLLTRDDERPLLPGPWHVAPAAVLLAGANAVALYFNLRRYVTGFDVERFSLESGAEWRRAGSPLGPTVLWIGGSVLFAAAIGLLAHAWLRERREHLEAPA